MDGGIHGKDALKVFKELCVAVDEIIEIYKEDGVALPSPKQIVFQTV